MVAGDIEYQFGWDDNFIPKTDATVPETRELFFSAVKHAMWDISD